jgi:hypothetical protein
MAGPTNRNHPLLEWPTFRPANLSACFHPTRSIGRWQSTGFISRRNIAKATGRISDQAIWQAGIFPGLIIVGALLC